MDGKTEIKYYVEECTREGKKVKNEHTILVDERFDDTHEADTFLDGSDVIENHVHLSELGFLWDWQIISIEYKSACSLAADRVLKWPIWEQRKKKAAKWKASLDKIEHNQGWLDPNGTFYPLYGLGVHYEFASEYIKKHYKNKIDNLYSRGSDALEELGWIRILNWSSGSIGVYNCKHGFKPTQRQIDFLARFALQFNKDFDKIIEEITLY